MTLFPFLYEYEKPLAIMALQNAVTSVLLKMPGLGGISWIPSLYMIFGDGATQYPKHHRSTTTTSQRYDLLYFFMYGGFGCYAQYMSYQWTIQRQQQEKNKINSDSSSIDSVSSTTLHQARTLGLFHIIIAMHHTLWAFLPGYGQLTLDRFSHGSRLPYWLEGIVAIITGYHGYQLLTASSQPETKLIRHKIMVDLSSFCSLIPIFGFWPMNLMGYTTTLFYETCVWFATPTIPLCLLGIDLVSSLSTTATTPTTTKKEE